MAAGAKSEQAFARLDVFARTTLATVLIVAAIAALAVTSLIQSNKRASAQPRALAQPALATAARSAALDSGAAGHFAFGHVEFDWAPADGVPGFDSWPPGRASNEASHERERRHERTLWAGQPAIATRRPHGLCVIASGARER